MDNEYCTVPLSGHITFDADGRMTTEFEYSKITAKSLADLLIRGFGIDVEDLHSSRDIPCKTITIGGNKHV